MSKVKLFSQVILADLSLVSHDYKNIINSMQIHLFYLYGSIFLFQCMDIF